MDPVSDHFRAALRSPGGSVVASALRKRAENGGKHLHHRDCIHNLPPEEQVAMRGKTVDWWTQVVGPLPEQITPNQWQTDPPTS